MTGTPEEHLKDLLSSPAFRAQLWEFIHDAPAVEPSTIDFHFAVQLVATLKEVWAEAFIAKGVPEAEAQAKVQRAITDQRDLYGSLAAGESPAGPQQG